ncbi:OB-fold nucleic acid binding domain protein [Methanocella conradii HZ254]|uniref:OB-fold nucleic acid binding domain protein n=1 Tax=Methanocella conradii (strain DSM 24694 / JCM 17849 / CGMCC 1.5162 / HZ254) TaxID=1041930 RepID=H8I7G8_METCZ|nr:OB-fold nucleic acid binding domain-containing protein [Methanocella conradii]AFD01178.1 OB-fold nucleic acid binding domain protein [Methanocella conradii HZ254]MDI6896984.1 OB-fold nucleic acid binding domain-containing protein [Methanocella conradii]
MRLKYEELAALIVLACALLAVGALYLLSTASTPYTWSSREGDRVTASGLLLAKEMTYRGGHIMLTIKTDCGPLTVFVPAASDAFQAASQVEHGNEIEATGIVQIYKGQKEILAEKIKKKS